MSIGIKIAVIGLIIIIFCRCIIKADEDTHAMDGGLDTFMCWLSGLSFIAIPVGIITHVWML